MGWEFGPLQRKVTDILHFTQITTSGYRNAENPPFNFYRLQKQRTTFGCGPVEAETRREQLCPLTHLEQYWTNTKQEPRTSLGRNAEINAVTEFPVSREGGDGRGYFN